MVPQQVLAAFERWYEQLAIHKPSGGPARGTIAAALVVLDRLKGDCDLSLDSHRAAGKSQIKGASGRAVARILAEFGESRPFLKEGGRTNRGAPRDIAAMLDALRATRIVAITGPERNGVIREMQGFLVARVREYHGRQRLPFRYDPSMTSWQTVHEWLRVAHENGKAGPVAQYLVGAKLELRFPDTEVPNESYSTADDQLGRPGDFLIGDTVFHVTVAPSMTLYGKCARNLEDGLRAFVLVPDDKLLGSRQNAEANRPGHIAVESVESFVSQNIEELSHFSKNRIAEGFRCLLETYNTRVDAAESDKSMLAEIPKNLARCRRK